MSSRPITPDAVLPSTRAMLDLLATDGQWHLTTDIVAAGVAACLTHEETDALRNGKRVRRRALDKGIEVARADLLASGANDLCRNRLMIAVRSGRVERDGAQHRMVPSAIAMWTAATDTPAATPAAPVVTARTASPATPATPVETATPAPTHNSRPEPRFANMTEAEGFSTSPLDEFTRVHFRTDFPIPLDAFRADVDANTRIQHDESTGLYRVDSTEFDGNALATLVKDWCARNNIITEGLRPEPRLVRRRNLRTLDPRFLDALCRHYAPYALKRVQRSKSTLRMHFSEDDDLTQRIYEWILEAIQMYDADCGVPFGAFLSTKLNSWVHDLNRQRFGRVLTDHENKTATAVAKFQQENHRLPTNAELAAAMGQTLPNFLKNAAAVATINSIRNIGSIDSGVDDPEIPLPGTDSPEDALMAATDKSLLSQALTASCAPDRSAPAASRAAKPNVLGLVTWYGTTWGGKNKTTLSAELNTSIRNMNSYADKAAVGMVEALS